MSDKVVVGIVSAMCAAAFAGSTVFVLVKQSRRAELRDCHAERKADGAALASLADRLAAAEHGSESLADRLAATERESKSLADKLAAAERDIESSVSEKHELSERVAQLSEKLVSATTEQQQLRDELATERAVNERLRKGDEEDGKRSREQQKATVSYPTIGKRNEGGVGVAATKGDLERFTRLSVARDVHGVAQMFRDGRLWEVAGGTRCLIITPRFFSTEVRILAGPHGGKVGWVASDFVHRR